MKEFIDSLILMISASFLSAFLLKVVVNMTYFEALKISLIVTVFGFTFNYIIVPFVMHFLKNK